MARRPPKEDAGARIPPRPTLTSLASAAKDCEACELHARATQTVFGEGRAKARILLVGEQPGDQEDRQGHLLDRALEEAGIDRADPPEAERARGGGVPPWLEAEIAVVKPEVIVCLGATAAQALLGRNFRVTQQRGVPVPSPLAPFVVATVHPSSILRAPDDRKRQEAMEAFVEDLRAVARLRSR